MRRWGNVCILVVFHITVGVSEWNDISKNLLSEYYHINWKGLRFRRTTTVTVISWKWHCLIIQLTLILFSIMPSAQKHHNWAAFQNPLGQYATFWKRELSFWLFERMSLIIPTSSMSLAHILLCLRKNQCDFMWLAEMYSNLTK